MKEGVFQQAIQAFDHMNAQDPHLVRFEGQEYPRELWYAGELTRWVLQLHPNASEALRLAARCQHLERWKIPRSGFPRGRIGYLNWRKKLAQFHASRAEETLRALHYSEDTVQRVRKLNLKLEIRHDPETQVLEDALCLVFLESQFAELSEKTEQARFVEIIQKTWKKMSSKARQMALKLDLDEPTRKLIEQAISKNG